MTSSEAYNGPIGGHGEPSSNHNTDYIFCDTCKRKLYPTTFIGTKRHIDLGNDTHVCFTCDQQIHPNKYTPNGWLKD